jgi:Ca2+-binding EF-hand superfamily protein
VFCVKPTPSSKALRTAGCIAVLVCIVTAFSGCKKRNDGVSVSPAKSDQAPTSQSPPEQTSDVNLEDPSVAVETAKGTSSSEPLKSNNVDTPSQEPPLQNSTSNSTNDAKLDVATNAPPEPLPTPIEMNEQSVAGRWTWRRYVLLADSGPILIDFQIAIGGQSLPQKILENKNEVIASLIPEAIDSTSWAQVVDSPKLSQNVFVNLRPTDDQQKKDLIKRYDLDGNGRASVNELYSYLTRGVGDRNNIIFDEANRFRSENTDEATVFSQLDIDQDGILSAEELSLSSARLTKLDLNGDFIISAAEVRPVEADPQAFMRQRNQNVDDAFIFMNPDDERGSAAAILRRYSFSNTIVPDDWRERSDLFAFLDVDQDRELLAKELRKIFSAPSDLVFQLEFMAIGQEASDTKTGQVSFRYRSRMMDAWSKIVGSETVNISNVRFRVRLADTLDVESIRVRTEQQASQLGITDSHPRDVEEMSSTTPNQVALAGLDFDSDKKVTYQEVEKAVVLKSRLTESFLRIRAIDPPDAWFTWLDSNWDDLLSEHEVANAASRIAQLKDSDDAPLLAALPGMQLEMVFTRTFGDEQPFQRPASPESGQQASNQSAPEWFQAMDANADGNVTIREFLGEASSFQALDANGDRILSSGEASVGGPDGGDAGLEEPK